MSEKKFDEKCYKETMDCLHASDDVLKEVLEMAEKNGRKKNRHGKMAYVAAAAVAICAVTGITFSTGVATYAEEALNFIEAKLNPASESEIETFADAALGDKSISTDHFERKTGSGEVLDDPDSQRIAVDQVTAQELLSGNVQNVDTSVDVGGNTFDFEQLVVDKNGNGMLSFTISNPDGVTGWYEAGYGEIYFRWNENSEGGLCDPILYSESGEDLDSRLLLREDISTDTELHLVACFTGNVQEDEGIRMDLKKVKDNGNDGRGQWIVLDQKSVTFDITNKLESVAMTDEDGNQIDVSPIGLVITEAVTTFDYVENLYEVIELEYQDGTEYVIKGEGVDNSVVSLRDQGKNWYVFNRLVDTSKLRSVHLIGYYSIDEETKIDYDRTYTCAE